MGIKKTLSVRKYQVALRKVLYPLCVPGFIRNEIKDCILVKIEMPYFSGTPVVDKQLNF